MSKEAVKAELTPEDQREWENALRGAKTGNPFATLCQHCMGRHGPPRNLRCPHESIDIVIARDRLSQGA